MLYHKNISHRRYNMKNLTIATILIGLSGTMLSAAVDESKLPADLQSKVQAAEQGASTAGNPVQLFVQSSSQTLDGFYTQLNQLLQEKGYLKGNPVTDVVQQTLKEIKTNLNSLKSAESAADTVSTDITVLPLLFQYLSSITPSENFPDVCKTYTAQKVTGLVETLAGKWTFYDPYTNTYYPFLSEITDVGLINSGAEYVVSRTPDEKVQDGYLAPDPLTTKQVVACLSNPYTPPTAPTSGTTKK